MELILAAACFSTYYPAQASTCKIILLAPDRSNFDGDRVYIIIVPDHAVVGFGPWPASICNLKTPFHSSTTTQHPMDSVRCVYDVGNAGS